MSLLASIRPTATTETVLYTVPASKKSVVNITYNNTNSSAVSYIRIGVQEAAGAFASKDYIVYDLIVYPNGSPGQITGIVLSQNQSIRVYVSAATVNFHCNGLEESE